MDAHEFEQLRRRAGANALIDLQVEGAKTTPVVINGVQLHRVNRTPLHVDLFRVKMTEDMTVDVVVHSFGESEAVTKEGGTLIHAVDHVRVRARPDHLPKFLEVDVSTLTTFDAVIAVRDLPVPAGATILNDPGRGDLPRPRPARRRGRAGGSGRGGSGRRACRGRSRRRVAAQPVAGRRRAGSIAGLDAGLLAGRVAPSDVARSECSSRHERRVPRERGVRQDVQRGVERGQDGRPDDRRELIEIGRAVVLDEERPSPRPVERVVEHGLPRLHVREAGVEKLGAGRDGGADRARVSPPAGIGAGTPRRSTVSARAASNAASIAHGLPSAAHTTNASTPPGRSTLRSPASAGARSGTRCSTNDETAASIEAGPRPAASGSATLPSTREIRARSSAASVASAAARARASMPAEMSSPTTRTSGQRRAAAIASVPDPVPASSSRAAGAFAITGSTASSRASAAGARTGAQHRP